MNWAFQFCVFFFQIMVSHWGTLIDSGNIKKTPMQLSCPVTHWISNSHESKRRVHELNAWLYSSANPLKWVSLVYNMIYKQKEQHHIYTSHIIYKWAYNWNAAALTGFHLNQSPSTQHRDQKEKKKLQNETNEAMQLLSHQPNVALGEYSTASHLIYADKC